MNTIHVHDVCRALWFLKDHGENREVYNLVDKGNTSMRYMYIYIMIVLYLYYIYTVGPFYSGHHWDKYKWPLLPLLETHLHI